MGENEQNIPAKRSPAKTTNHRRMSNSEGLRIRGYSSRVRMQSRPSEEVWFSIRDKGPDSYCSQSWAERSVTQRLRREIQAVLRRGNGELNALWICSESPETQCDN